MQLRRFHAGVVVLLPVLLLAFLPICAWAGTQKVLHEFNASPEGIAPMAGLVSDAVGNLYGTSVSSLSLIDDYGAVFELVLGPDGKYRPRVLHAFTGGTDGRAPMSGVTLDAAGNVWGTTYLGGDYDGGIVYRLTPAHGRWEKTTIYSFGGVKGDGWSPVGGLTFDKAGNIYGTTANGGDTRYWSQGLGTVFTLVKGTDANWTESVIHDFECDPDGCFPGSAVAVDSSGRLYGVTTAGGEYSGNFVCNYNCGVAFMMTPSAAGWSESVIFDFGATREDGMEPFGSPILDAAGNLYGTTQLGGSGGYGAVYELSPAAGGAWTQTMLYSFSGGADGNDPYAGVVFDAQGNLYGTTYEGGVGGCGVGGMGCGTVFGLSPSASGAWKETTIYTFQGGRDGGTPYGGIIVDGKGNLYGTAYAGGYSHNGAVFGISPASGGKWKEKVIFGFPDVDGTNPQANVVLDGLNNIYGTTAAGGICNESVYSDGYSGCGTVFELTPSSGGKWTRKLLYQFRGQYGGDGEEPTGGLIFDHSGNLYGTTNIGGKFNGGIVFKLSPGSNGRWTEHILYNFRNRRDGGLPAGPLAFDADGNLYGTTSAGGNCGYYYCFGAVFKLSPSTRGWTEKVLYRFRQRLDGAEPMGGLIFDSAGNLYGTTKIGGSNGSGTVFMLSPGRGGWVEKTIHAFSNPNDGAYPLCTLVMDGGDNLYGTTSSGGSYGEGTVFELSHSAEGWKGSVLYTFTGKSDGGAPAAGLIFDSSGNLYGTTEYGGNSYQDYGSGTVFELSPSEGSWTESVVYTFNGGLDGAFPQASLVLDGGTLYGTAFASTDEGVAFSVTP